MIVRLLRTLFVVVGAAATTFVVFMVLPLMQTIRDPLRSDLLVRDIDDVALPPPPPSAPPIEPEPEEQPPPPPPRLTAEAPPLDLSQLELALNPGVGEGVFGDFAVDLATLVTQVEDDQAERIFSLEELDQRPRLLFQRAPRYPPDLLRARRAGTVFVVFIVDREGRVTQPKVQKSTDPGFEQPALEAVRQWRFEPGTREGQSVPFKMRVPIKFDAG